MLFAFAALCALSALLAARAAGRLRRQILRTNCLASMALQRAADEESGKETALRLLEEQRLARLAEYEQYAARLLALQTQYEETLAHYRAALRTYREALARGDEDAPITH